MSPTAGYKQGRFLFRSINMENDMTKSINLPDEIVMEILLFLPIKSLMRFRCVNKTWLQFLTNPDSQFAKSYLTKSNQHISTIIALRLEKFQDKPNIYSAVELSDIVGAIDFELPFSATFKSYRIGGVCNGLVLLRLSNRFDRFFVWNPLTNDYIHLPSLPILDDHKDCIKYTNSGFGFLQATNQYKVLSFNEYPYSSFEPKSRVIVYTLGTDSSWRNLGVISYHTFSHGWAAPLINGALHWTAFIGGPLFVESKRILSFDMKDEIFREILFPNEVNTNYRIHFDDTVGDLGGSLCILGRDRQENIEVWVMQEYGIANSWTKLFTIERPDIYGSFASLRLMHVVHNGEMLRMTSILIKTLTETYLYYPETNSIKNLAEFGLHLYEAFSYTPSFISPRAIIVGGGLFAVWCASCTYTSSSLTSPRPVNSGRERLTIQRMPYKSINEAGRSINSRLKRIVVHQYCG